MDSGIELMLRQNTLSTQWRTACITFGARAPWQSVDGASHLHLRYERSACTPCRKGCCLLAVLPRQIAHSKPTSKEGVSIGCLDLKHSPHNFQDGHIEGTATQVIPARQDAHGTTNWRNVGRHESFLERDGMSVLQTEEHLPLGADIIKS
eukprot:scaffold196773_cov20-Tisochrysis_lutea.AAC.2